MRFRLLSFTPSRACNSTLTFTGARAHFPLPIWWTINCFKSSPNNLPRHILWTFTLALLRLSIFFTSVRQRFQVGVLSGLNGMESFSLDCRTGRFSQTLTDIMTQLSRKLKHRLKNITRAIIAKSEWPESLFRLCGWSQEGLRNVFSPDCILEWLAELSAPSSALENRLWRFLGEILKMLHLHNSNVKCDNGLCARWALA